MFGEQSIHETPPSANSPSYSQAAELERRAVPQPWFDWMSAMLDEVDYGLLRVDGRGRLQHANHAARQAMAQATAALRIEQQHVRARHPSDQAPLAEAIDGAARRSLRKLLVMHSSAQHPAGASLAVVPLEALGREQPCAVLLVLGRQRLAAGLALQCFASSHGLTHGESRVLGALCDGSAPQRIADCHGVALSTVRTQIGKLRAKTGATTIRALVNRVALPPPLVGALRAQCE